MTLPDGPKLKITYTINTGGEVFRVGSWETSSPFSVGAVIPIEVSVRAFNTKNGPQFSLEHKAGGAGREEEF